jgi:hypothetical protein
MGLEAEVGQQMSEPFWGYGSATRSQRFDHKVRVIQERSFAEDY